MVKKNCNSFEERDAHTKIFEIGATWLCGHNCQFPSQQSETTHVAWLKTIAKIRIYLPIPFDPRRENYHKIYIGKRILAIMIETNATSTIYQLAQESANTINLLAQKCSVHILKILK